MYRHRHRGRFVRTFLSIINLYVVRRYTVEETQDRIYINGSEYQSVFNIIASARMNLVKFCFYVP